VTLVGIFAPGANPNLNRIEVELRGDRSGNPLHVQTWSHTGVTQQSAEYADQFAVGEWSHVLLTHKADGTQLKVHVDGVRLTGSNVTDGSGFMRNRDREIVIGADSTRLARLFEGRIGHVALWGRRLGSRQARDIYEHGHDADLREVFGSRYKPNRLRHYWRLGEDLGQIGADWILSNPVDLDQLIGLDETDVVDDAP